jgi:exo-beta-1,3-glucanase (GH17 family)
MRIRLPALRHLLAASALALLLAWLAGCAGAAGAPGALPAASAHPIALRPLAPAFFSRKAVAYSGYRGADHHTPPTEAQVLQDLQLLLQAHYGLLRMFGADDADTGVVLRTIRAHRLDLKLQLGIWIAGPVKTADAANQTQIASGIALARAYPDIVLAVSVGNETMVDWSMHVPPADIAAYVQQVRRAVTQPVTTDDNWAVFADDGGKYPAIGQVLAQLDFVSMHTYPLLDSVYVPSFTGWQHRELPEPQRSVAMIDTFFRKAQADHDAVRRHLASLGHGALPITIGETGWKAVGAQLDRIDPGKQTLYAERLAAWHDGPRQIFWFEAFDEPWKGDDDGWGLFDVERRPRPVVQAFFPAASEPARASSVKSPQ